MVIKSGRNIDHVINVYKKKKMINISKPWIEKVGDKVYLKSHIKDDYQNIDEDIWYSTPEEYGQYFCDEIADAFVISVLLQAIRYGEDIVVDAAISEKLYFNLQFSLIHTISISWGDISNKIKVTPKEVMKPNFHSFAVGCGCSLGVDSLSAIFRYTSKECPESYRITHLTYFNVGAMGYKDLEKAQSSFKKDLSMVRDFADAYKLPLVCIESNISILYRDFDFDQSGIIRNMSAVLSMQKLFRVYYFASGQPNQNFEFTTTVMSHYGSLLLPLMSTESTELVVADQDKSRIDKTKSLMDNPIAHQHLYVCWKELIANKNPQSEVERVKDKFLNCTRCDKCLRTALTLDILGKLNLFKEIFDLDYYYRVRDKYTCKVLLNKDKSFMYRDIVLLMEQVHFPISARVKRELFLKRSIIYRIGSTAYHKICKK